MQARQGADDFQMAQLFGADVHQQVFASGIVAVQSLNCVLHGRRQLAVCASELFEQHVAKPRIRLIDMHGVHELLDVVIHKVSLSRAGRARCADISGAAVAVSRPRCRGLR